MQKPVHILLADDDPDDRFFFAKTLRKLSLTTDLTMVDNGEILMEYLFLNSNNLPDVLFLDLNMPRKNGFECLTEIKSDARLKSLPVIIYSTSIHRDIADVLFKSGAHYFLRKTHHNELKKVLVRLLPLIAGKHFERPGREEFTLDTIEV